MSDHESTTLREVPIDEHVLEDVADGSGVDVDELVDALVVFDAELRGHHSELEDNDYVTVDGRRAYAVSTVEWESMLTTLGLDDTFDDSLTMVLSEAHTRQAKLLFDSTVKSTQFDSGTVGVVIGVDTAEEMV